MQAGTLWKTENVNVIENGDVLTEVESFFEGNSSFVRISYKMYRDMPYTDIRVDVLWNEQQKALKIKRIFLVADFAGQSAEKILFDQESLLGYPA